MRRLALARALARRASLPRRVDIPAGALSSRYNHDHGNLPTTQVQRLTTSTTAANKTENGSWNALANCAIIVAGMTWIMYDTVVKAPKERMTPRGLIRETLEVLRANPEVTEYLGTPLRSIECSSSGKEAEFVDLADDDDKPVFRIKFNVQGPEGEAYVYAEVDGRMNKGEYRYLLVEFTSSGSVLELIDNRPQQASGALAQGMTAERPTAFW